MLRTNWFFHIIVGFVSSDLFLSCGTLPLPTSPRIFLHPGIFSSERVLGIQRLKKLNSLNSTFFRLCAWSNSVKPCSTTCCLMLSLLYTCIPLILGMRPLCFCQSCLCNWNTYHNELLPACDICDQISIDIHAMAFSINLELLHTSFYFFSSPRIRNSCVIFGFNSSIACSESGVQNVRGFFCKVDSKTEASVTQSVSFTTWKKSWKMDWKHEVLQNIVLRKKWLDLEVWWLSISTNEVVMSLISPCLTLQSSFGLCKLY